MIVPGIDLGARSGHHLISAASTNLTSVKAGRAQLNAGVISNLNAAARFFKLYDKASAPDPAADTPVLTLYLPPTSNTVVPVGFCGLNFANGLAYSLVTGIAITNAVAVGAAEHSVFLSYT